MEMKPYKPEGFTKWDKFLIREGDITIGQLLEVMKARYGLTITFIESKAANDARSDDRVGAAGLCAVSACTMLMALYDTARGLDSSCVSLCLYDPSVPQVCQSVLVTAAVYNGMGSKAAKVTTLLTKKFPKLHLTKAPATSTTFIVFAENADGESVLVPYIVFSWA
jgi:hypothetical protein